MTGDGAPALAAVTSTSVVGVAPGRRHPRPATANVVVLALVIALRDVEHRRAASNMGGDGPSRRTTA